VLLVILGIASAWAGNIIGGMWWFLIGLFVYAAAAAGFQQLITQQALRGRTVRRFMTTDPVTVPAETTVREFIDQYLYHHALDVFPVVQDGRLVGCASLHQVKQIPRENWARLRVGAVCQACDVANTVDAGTDAEEALRLMQSSRNGRLMVTENDRLVGMLVLKDLLRFLQLRTKLDEER
jgi:predicted transcriptional regulator